MTNKTYTISEKQLTDCSNNLQMIWALGYDYDGFNTVESLKDLVDELVEYANKARRILAEVKNDE